LLVIELVTQLHDTHGFAYGSAVLADQLGEQYRLELANCAGHVVVARRLPTAPAESLPPVAGAGAGVPVQRLLARYRLYVAAFSAAAAQREGLR
jgi:hypothetical protein